MRIPRIRRANRYGDPTPSSDELWEMDDGSELYRAESNKDDENSQANAISKLINTAKEKGHSKIRVKNRIFGIKRK